MSVPPVQDSPPAGGFKNIRYARNLPRRGPSGAVMLLAVFGVMTYGFIKTAEGNAERRELRREKVWARIHLIPLLQAEQDRDLVRRADILAAREAEIMKDTKDWAPLDLKAPVGGIGKFGVKNEEAAEPVYHTKRYVAPSLVFLPKEQGNVIGAQWWRGSTVLTKNPPYQDREDFTKEHPIGQ
ncbi:hypothetical protein HDV03_004916 [Kappamyces sp. JEL0829]|nr:hypothetical protein HDV03_004916 [Kappamyces sp. JEL0829]